MHRQHGLSVTAHEPIPLHRLGKGTGCEFGLHSGLTFWAAAEVCVAWKASAAAITSSVEVIVVGARLASLPVSSSEMASWDSSEFTDPTKLTETCSAALI